MRRRLRLLYPSQHKKALTIPASAFYHPSLYNRYGVVTSGSAPSGVLMSR
jgi:hypothetical protein